MKSKCYRIGLWLGSLCLCLLVVGGTAKAAIDISGTFRNDLTIRQYQQMNSSDELKIGDKNTLRLNFKDMIRPNLKVEGSFDALLLAGDDADIYLLSSAAAGSKPTFSIQDTNFVALFSPRKLYLALLADDYTLTLGRQIINYGVGHIFSPIDCFSTVDLQDFGFSRVGSDILRWQKPLGDLAGLEVVSTITDDNTSAIKIFGNWFDYDLGLIGIYKKAQNEIIAGFTFKGDLVIGIHGELVQHFSSSADTNYFEGMLGADYSFLDGKILFLAEYYHNGNPIDLNASSVQDSSILNRPFLAEHYLFFQTSYFYDELRSFSLNQIRNLSGESWLSSFQFSYNILQNTNLLLSARHFSGNLNGSDIPNPLQSEYGIGIEVKF